MKNTYEQKMYCSNCGYSYTAKFPTGISCKGEQICENCGCPSAHSLREYPKTNKSIREVEAWALLRNNELFENVLGFWVNPSREKIIPWIDSDYSQKIVPCTITYLIPKPIKRK